MGYDARLAKAARAAKTAGLGSLDDDTVREGWNMGGVVSGRQIKVAAEVLEAILWQASK